MDTGLKLQQLFPSFLFASTVSVLVAAPAFAQVIQVTGVRVETTSIGVEVILETNSDTIPQVSTTSLDKTLLTNIFNTQLRLPEGQAFRQDNPVEGISSVTVTQLAPNTIRVTATGTTELPAVKVSPGTSGLVFSLSVSPTTAQTPSTETPTPETPETQPPDEPEATPTPENKPQSPTATPDSEEEIEIVVTGEQNEDRYFAPDASTATRTDTPIRDIPQSIQVIPERVLEDQQVIDIEEALTNVSGVTFGGTTGNSTVDFNIRGFDNAPVLQDGFRQFGGFGQNVSETANLQRVEVLKGPASVLYGEIQPGGVINLVSKQPLAEPFYQAEIQVGNRGLFRPQIDISGPLTTDKRLRYRLNALYRHEESFRDFKQDFERFSVAPIVSWQIGDRTNLTVQFEYTDDKVPLDNGLVAVGDRIVDVPFERIIDEPDNVGKNQFLNVGYNLEHRFSNNWRIRNAFRYTNRSVLNIGAIPFDFDENSGIVSRFFGRQDVDTKNYSLQTNVVGEFATGSIKHTLLFGVDLNRTESQEIAGGDFFNLQPLNIFDPVYGSFANVDPDELPLFRNIENKINRLGVYLQEQVKFADNLILLAGLRYDTVDQTTVNGSTDLNPTSSETNQNNDALTPRLGIVYQPIPDISLYASYSQSFTPNTGITSNGSPLEPERGEGFEVGIKTELLDRRLAATLAYFDITRQNVATTDPNDLFSSVATGEQQSRGLELDVSGEILPGWRVIASYAFINAEVTADNQLPEGNRLFNTPKHSASLWTTYEIQQGNLQGLGFGIGFNFVGEREGDLANSFQVDSYFLTNAAIFYRRNNWRFALNVKNLFDSDYVAATSNSRIFGNEPGAPFTIIGSVSVQF